MRKAVLICLFLFVGFALLAETVSLEQARVLALTNSRSLAQYNLRIRSSEVDERTQLYSMLPSLSASYSAGINYLDSNRGVVNPMDTLNARATISISQTIFEGGKSFIRKAISELATEGVRNDALAEYFNVLDSVDNAYYSALEAAASLEAAESSLQSAILSLSMAEIRQANGMLNQSDYLRTLADKESRESARNQARRSLSLSMSRLNTLLGLGEAPELTQIDFSAYEEVIQYLAGISDEDAGALYDRLWDAITRANPSLVRAALSRQRAEHNYTLSQRDYVPTISATLFSTGLNWSLNNGFSTSSSGGVSITGRIPLDFWVLSATLEKNKIAYDSAMMDYVGAGISLETELYSSLINTIAQAESVLSSRRTLSYVELNYEYVLERYRLAQASVSEFGDSSSLIITNRNNYIRSSYGFLQSISKLRSLTAMEDEEKLIALLMGN